MRIANEAQLSAIMAKSNIYPVSLPRRQRASLNDVRIAVFLVSHTHVLVMEWTAGAMRKTGPATRLGRPTFTQCSLLVRSGLDLALGQKQGSLSEQDQHTEAIQDYIQHDPSPWRFRGARVLGRVPGDTGECGGQARWASMGN
jgi:hypothetical protein